MDSTHRPNGFHMAAVNDPRLLRLGQKRPHRQRLATVTGNLMRPQYLKWILVPTLDQLPNGV